MAKKSAIETNLRRKKLVEKYKNKRAALKAIVANKDLHAEERFAAQVKLSELPRNSSAVRVRNRCQITGRPRGVYSEFGISRIALRDMASFGLLPGVEKSSW